MELRSLEDRTADILEKSKWGEPYRPYTYNPDTLVPYEEKVDAILAAVRRNITFWNEYSVGFLRSSDHTPLQHPLVGPCTTTTTRSAPLSRAHRRSSHHLSAPGKWPCRAHRTENWIC